VRAIIDAYLARSGQPSDAITEADYARIERDARAIHDEARSMGGKLLASPAETAAGYIRMSLAYLLHKSGR
jgi:hypothetical protein